MHLEGTDRTDKNYFCQFCQFLTGRYLPNSGCFMNRWFEEFLSNAEARNVLKNSISPTDKTDKTPEDTSSTTAELEASMRRMVAADISIAVWVTEIDAGIKVTDRLVQGNAVAKQALAEGAVVYTPQEMMAYIQLEPHQRRMLHSFKKRFGGTVEWREEE